MRVLLAVVTGYLIFAITAALLFQLSGQNPHAKPGVMFGVVSLLWGILFAMLGGYVAVRLAHRVSVMPSVLVGCLIATGALASLLFEGEGDSIWSQLSALLLMAPGACAGGFLQLRSQKTPGPQKPF